jgi:beta-glucanase (GH16 family)
MLTKAITMNSKNAIISLATLLILFFGLQKSSAQCYELVWSDEFDYTGYPDPAVWNMEVGNNNGANAEKQYYTKNDMDNCWVDGGRMVITAKKETLGGQAYTSARINTKGKKEFKYGKIEARLKLPYGQGIWPAFWMLGGNIDQVRWPKCGEIDIMEMVGGTGYNDRTIYGTPHWWDEAQGKKVQFDGSQKTLTTGRFADDYHVFSIEWTPLKIAWFMDGTQFKVMSTTPATLSEFQLNYFIILNLAVGGEWPGYPDATTVFPQTFEVDYVRVYQTISNELIMGKDSVVAKESNLSYNLPALAGRTFLWSVPAGASIVSRADSNAVVVNWGCARANITCSVTTNCVTTVVKSKTVNILKPKIAGTIFYGKTAGNLVFSVPQLNETKYLWTIPADASFISTDTAASATIKWGTTAGLVNVNITNSCSTTDLSKKIYKYGQYSYPNPETPAVIPGTITSTNYDYGGEGVAYHDVEANNQGSANLREDEGVDTELQPLFTNVGWIIAGEWLEYSIKVPLAGYYKIEMKVASGATTGIGPARVLVNGETRIGDIAIAATGAWNTFVTVSQRLLYLNTTDTVLRIQAVGGNFNLGPITLSVDKTVAVKDINSQSSLAQLFPNPVNDVLNISFLLSKRGDVNISISDISGKQYISSTSRGLEKGEQKIVLDEKINALQSGMYIIEINTPDQKYFSKFIKN